MLQMISNLRNFPRDVFSSLRLVLERLDTIAGRVDVLEKKQYNIHPEVIQKVTSGISSMNEFCDEATQFLIEQHRDIIALLNSQKELLEHSKNTELLTKNIVPEIEQNMPAFFQKYSDANLRFAEKYDAKLTAIETLIRSHETLFPSWYATPEGSEEIRRTLRFLTPYKAKGPKKCRLGRDYDGGYVMLDDFPAGTVALSLGINDDVSWDLAMAERGCEVFQYDHTIDVLPAQHERFHFHSHRITAQEDSNSRTLDSAILENPIPLDAPVILKIDIEGDEWSVFDAVSTETLGRFTQILVEFHHMERLSDPEFHARANRVFKKLADKFFVYHVHGNNCGNLANVQNIVVPQSLEISFARKELYPFEETNEIFPQALDMPNQEGRADFYLGCFKF